MTAPASHAVPRLAMIFRLVAGRGAFRLGSQVMAIALVAVWGVDEFGGYANALGLCAWLVFLTMAPEKAALRTLPRTRVITAAVARLVVRTTLAPVVLVVVALAVSLVLAPESRATLYLAAAAWSLATGTMMTVAALHRLRGKHSFDAATFTALAVVVLGVTTATWVIRWSPLHHLVVLDVATLVVLAVVTLALPRDWLVSSSPHRGGLFRRLATTSALLGLSDVLSSVANSSVYLLLALYGRTVDSGPFYLGLTLSGAFCQFVVYQLKLNQPKISARLRGPGAVAGRAQASALLLKAVRLGAGIGLVFFAATAVPAFRAFVDDGGFGTISVLVVLVCLEVGVFLLVTYAGFLLENTNGRALFTTTSAAAAGLVATCAFAAVLVPLFGAVGGYVALLLAVAVNGYVMRALLLRRHPDETSAATTVVERVTVH